MEYSLKGRALVCGTKEVGSIPTIPPLSLNGKATLFERVDLCSNHSKVIFNIYIKKNLNIQIHIEPEY